MMITRRFKVFAFFGVTLMIACIQLFLLYRLAKRKPPHIKPLPEPENIIDWPPLEKIPFYHPSENMHRSFPSKFGVIVLFRVLVDDPDINCDLLQNSVQNVLQSSWKKLSIFLMVPLFDTNEWHTCLSSRKLEKKVTLIPKDYAASLQQAIMRIVKERDAGFVLMMQPGDQIRATYLESAIWTLYSRKNRVGYVTSTFATINAEGIVEAEFKNSHSSAITDFYGTSPGAVFRADAIEQAGAFITEYNKSGCEDWEAKWRMHYAKWSTFSITTLQYFIYTKNIHSPNAKHMRCLLKSDSDMVLEYLKSKYAIPSVVFETIPDYSANMRRQYIKATPWDPIKVAGPPVPIPRQQRRLLLLIPWLVIGGAEAFSLNIIKTFAQRGWHVTIVMSTDYSAYGTNVWEHIAREDTADIFHTPYFIDRNFYHMFICHLVRSRGIDAILNTNSFLAYTAIPYIDALCPVGSMVDVNHNWFDGWMEGGYATLAIDYQSKMDHLVQISQQLATKMIQEGADAEKVKVTYIGTNTTYYTNNHDANKQSRAQCLREFAPSLFSTEKEKFVVVYLGRLSGEKQPDVFLETVISMKGNHENFAAIIAGDGAMNGQLRSRINQANANDVVHMAGPVNAEQKRRLLSCADVLMMTSATEGTPLVIFEAMSIGMAIIAPKSGGIPEMVTPDVGTLIDNTDISKKEQADLYLAALTSIMKKSPEELQSIKQRARHRAVNKFDINICAANIEQWIMQSIAQKRKQGWKRMDKLKSWPRKMSRKEKDDAEIALALTRMLLPSV